MKQLKPHSAKREDSPLTITVGARSSPLSKTQVDEVLTALRFFYPQVNFQIHAIQTLGDNDQKTSLRSLGKTDFFTKEIDALVLNQTCRIAIHSAKDLPDPLPVGLKIICLTKGLDPSDSLVFRHHENLHTLPKGALIATSSERREESVKKVRSDLTFCDVRGTIEQRLKLLDGEVDGVVIAEAALIRLGLTHLNRIKLMDSTVKGQGQLAIVAREEDIEMEDLFLCIDNKTAN